MKTVRDPQDIENVVTCLGMISICSQLAIRPSDTDL